MSILIASSTDARTASHMLPAATDGAEAIPAASSIGAVGSITPARILVACEFSGRVRDAFRAQGHDAVSCDLLPSDAPGPHIQGDVRDVLAAQQWDALIAFPPCTHLCSSGARWWSQKREQQNQAIEFVLSLWNCGIPRIAIENPIGILSRVLGRPAQIVQPWQYGHGETKSTCLWLKGLPTLTPNNIVVGREARVHRMPPSADRWKLRSTTYQGIAQAMASQWSGAVR